MVMSEREAKGLVIAEQGSIVKTPVGWKVPSQSGKGAYVVSVGDRPFCTCPDYEARNERCKHIYAVETILQRQENADGSTTYTQAVRVTYGQQWTVYNDAQTHEQDYFVSLLRDLCSTIPQPPQTFGRPRLPLSDVVFGIALKVYGTMSGRRSMSDLRDAEAKGLMGKAPSFTSGFRYLEDSDLTPILKALIEQTAMPLKAVETDFAVDSSGFASTTYNRWFDHKWGKMRSEAKWVKAHLMCGVKTHIVTSVEVSPTEDADAPHCDSDADGCGHWATEYLDARIAGVVGDALCSAYRCCHRPLLSLCVCADTMRHSLGTNGDGVSSVLAFRASVRRQRALGP